MDFRWLLLVIPLWPLIGVSLGGSFLSYLVDRGIIKTSSNEVSRFILEILIIPLCFPCCLLIDLTKFVYKRVAPVFSVFRFNSLGDVSMKRKLFVAMLYMVTGFFAPNLFTHVNDWWKAPPAPPGAEATNLIQSLNSANGWKVQADEHGVRVTKGHVAVKPCRWYADVEVNAADANPNFTRTDLRNINDAAKQCLRKLTIKEMVASESDVGTVKDLGTHYIVETQHGTVYKINK